MAGQHWPLGRWSKASISTTILTPVIRLSFAVLVVTLLAAAPQLNADQAAASTEYGWWIRINTAATKASEIVWQFGTTANELIFKTRWQRGMGGDVLLPDPIRLEGFIDLRVTTLPADATASFCVFWRQQGVAFVEFAGTADRQLHVSMNEPRCRMRLF